MAITLLIILVLGSFDIGGPVRFPLLASRGMPAPYSFLSSESKADLHDPAEGKSLVGHLEDDFDYAEPLSTRSRTPSKVVTWALYALCIATMLLAITNLGVAISRATTGRRIPIEKLPKPDIEIGLQK